MITVGNIGGTIGETRDVTNGVIGTYRSSSENIAADTFVELKEQLSNEDGLSVIKNQSMQVEKKSLSTGRTVSVKMDDGRFVSARADILIGYRDTYDAVYGSTIRVHAINGNTATTQYELPFSDGSIFAMVPISENAIAALYSNQMTSALNPPVYIAAITIGSNGVSVTSKLFYANYVNYDDFKIIKAGDGKAMLLHAVTGTTNEAYAAVYFLSGTTLSQKSKVKIISNSENVDNEANINGLYRNERARIMIRFGDNAYSACLSVNSSGTISVVRTQLALNSNFYGEQMVDGYGDHDLVALVKSGYYPAVERYIITDTGTSVETTRIGNMLIEYSYDIVKFSNSEYGVFSTYRETLYGALLHVNSGEFENVTKNDYIKMFALAGANSQFDAFSNTHFVYPLDASYERFATFIGIETGIGSNATYDIVFLLMARKECDTVIEKAATRIDGITMTMSTANTAGKTWFLTGYSGTGDPIDYLESAIRSANEAANGASLAAQNAVNITDLIQSKLNSGEFIGKDGPQGLQGEAATIELGNVETGDPGTDAEVHNSGTNTDAVFDFTIPRGEPGAATVQIGKVYTSEPGTDAKVENVGTQNAAILDFTIPSGKNGEGAGILEYENKSTFPDMGESGKIYVDTTANLFYRWSGSGYVEIPQPLELGDTDSTAFRGDLGKEAYDNAKNALELFDNLEIGKVYTGEKLVEAVPSKDKTIAANLTLPAGIYIITANIGWMENLDAWGSIIMYVDGEMSAVDRRTMNFGGGGSLALTGVFEKEKKVEISVYNEADHEVEIWVNLNAIKIK